MLTCFHVCLLHVFFHILKEMQKHRWQQHQKKEQQIFLQLFLFISLFSAQLHHASARLVHVQVFFRHGARTPTSFLAFPTEQNPPPAAADGVLELGELTFQGTWQEYLLGQSLRSMYGQLLGGRYRPKEINVYSGRDNRTVASALLVLAGLFPPQGDQLWNRQLPWQPIPVETVGILDHPSFGMFDHCPREKQRMESSAGYAQLQTRFAAEMEELSERTGVNISGQLNILQKVQDSIVTRADMPKLLPLPDWARNPRYLAHARQSRLALHEALIDLFLEGMGGWHLDLMLGRMDDVVHGRTRQKAVLFSSHDTNFLTLGRFLNISRVDNLFTDYASLLAFELHQHQAPQEGNISSSVAASYNVELKFRNGLNGTLEQLQIADCPSPCSLDKFRALRPRVTTAQWMGICQGFPAGADSAGGAIGDDQCTLFGSIAGALTVLVVLLLGFLLSLLLSCRSYKRRYEQLAEELLDDDDAEKRPLLLNKNGARRVRQGRAGQ